MTDNHGKLNEIHTRD